MTTLYFGHSGSKLQFQGNGAEGITVPMQKILFLRKRLFTRRKRADALAALLAELLGRPA
jgi:hypothetical protein